MSLHLTFVVTRQPCRLATGLKSRRVHYPNSLDFQRLPRQLVCRVGEQQQTGKQEDLDNCNYNIGEFCSIDDKGKKIESRSLGEKEAEFIQALQSYYYDGKSVMSDEEFENLKEELIWSGSKIAVLSSKEQKFLEASRAYQSGYRVSNLSNESQEERD
eukprot:TRINITY_DN40058_c0_g2_i2.p1 TRINITY_DN40058_c0_g2~~TRINITY_DN40058_c0_g2_i2.p1  ORF type:complete len:158 (-),score=16.99 TRINITY_DN40058_c0_g2_i2:94-567(-)